MTTLFRRPVETTGSGRIVGLGALGLATLAMLGLFWWTFSPILGRVYSAIRLAESATLWTFTDWGSYFTTMPAGQPFAFVSIYKSSVPFGLAAGVLTALLGFLAWRKRSREHIEVLITVPAKALSQQGVLDAYAPPYCLVREPVARPEAPEVEASEPATIGTDNPFEALRDLRDARAVEAVADSVPWHRAAALFLTLDAAVPLKDRKGRTAVLTAAWTAANRFADDPLAEPPAQILADLRSHMVWAITDMNGRPADGLNRIHAVLGSQGSLDVAITRLGSFALDEGGLFFPDYAWLCHVDRSLQAAITSY